MSLSIDQLDFDLDPDLVARHPAEPRENARMMVVDLASDRVEHRRVADLGEYLAKGDRIVLNTTHVDPARFEAIREDTGGHLEGLLLERVGPRAWWARLRKSRRLKPGHRLRLVGRGDDVEAVLEVAAIDDGRVLVHLGGDALVQDVLGAVGHVPLPPYIRSARRDHGEPIEDDRDGAWYQTVYAQADGPTHSVAAPTAGLHLSKPLLRGLADQGVARIDLALEVGEGTFKPVETATLAEHRMHRERCVIGQEAIDHLRDRSAGRVIPVGTTAVRTLESLPESLPREGGLEFWTDLLIEPGFQFRFLDGLLTNFHLPRSTLLALVAAITGLDRLHALYAEARCERYRFFSYGDAMLLLGADAP